MKVSIVLPFQIQFESSVEYNESYLPRLVSFLENKEIPRIIERHEVNTIRLLWLGLDLDKIEKDDLENLLNHLENFLVNPRPFLMRFSGMMSKLVYSSWTIYKDEN